MNTHSSSRPIRWIGLLVALLSLAAIGCLSPAVLTPTPAQSTAEPAPVVTVAPVQPTTDQPLVIEADAEETLLINLYNRVNPAVVHIRIYAEGVLLGSGSGFLVDNNRHVVTNNHVVLDAEEMEIIFADSTRVRGEVIGYDEDADLAVIEVASVPAGTVPLELGRFGSSSGRPAGDCHRQPLRPARHADRRSDQRIGPPTRIPTSH